MFGRLFFTEGLRLGTLLTVLGAALSPSDVAAQLPLAGSEEPALVIDDHEGVGLKDPRLLTANEMMSLSVKYSFDIQNTVAQVEALRREASVTRDGIKVACVDRLMPELRMLRDTLAPRFTAIARRTDEFLARADFLVISPGWKRVRELRQEAEECVGESLDSSVVTATTAEIPPSNGIEPTSDVPVHPVIVDRPQEASIYR